MSGRVLIIDDDRDIREMLSLVLSVRGYDATTAADGGEALDQMRAGPLPDLVLLDLMMPGVNGAELVAAMQADPQLRSIPVVVLSGDLRIAESTAQLGAAGYLRKPVELADLVDTVARYAGRDPDGHVPAP